MIGEAALDVTPLDTVVPATVPVDFPVASFRLKEIEDQLTDPSILDAFATATPPGPFALPGFDSEVPAATLDAAAGRLLARTGRRSCFIPVVGSDHWPRLGLAYRRADDSSRTIVSASPPDAFVHELSEWIQDARAQSLSPDASRERERRTTVPPVVSEVARFGEIETLSPRFATVLEQIAHVAGTELSILLLGESGTGKEHLAQAIHRASPRAQGPFVAVNCSAISENLIESELFGHKKGAFTGAQTDRAGAFVAASGGTLLLDEIGDAPLRVQLALLRALEAKTVRAVGSDIDRHVDVRVLAATSRDLTDLIAERAFRKDLYYRLAEISVELPPLRERKEDIPRLVTQLLNTLGKPLPVSRQAETLLQQHQWPGNVRELRNALKRAVAMRRGADVLEAVHFLELGGTGAGATVDEDPAFPFPPHVERRADEIWSDQALGEELASNRYAQRALNRAALLCLAARAPMTTWPAALTREWHRLFMERWATAEEGRGLRGVMRQLGMDPRDKPDEERVIAEVLRARRRRT